MSNVKVGSDPIYDARSIGVPRMLVLNLGVPPTEFD